MPLRSLLLTASLVTVLIFLFKDKLMSSGFDIWVLFTGNLLLLVFTLISSYFHSKGAADKNPNAFIRSVYAATMLKMFGVAIAVMIYAFIAKPFNKYAVVSCMLLYIVYTVIEVKAAMKMIKASR